MRKEEKERLEFLESKEEKRKELKRAREKRYNENTVDRLNITVPRGKKAEIQKAAAARGLSVNMFVQSLILAAIDSPGPE